MNYSEELQQLLDLFDKYKLVGVTQFAESRGVTRQGVCQAIKRKRLPVIELGGKLFVIGSLA